MCSAVLGTQYKLSKLLIELNGSTNFTIGKKQTLLLLLLLIMIVMIIILNNPKSLSAPTSTTPWCPVSRLRWVLETSQKLVLIPWEVTFRNSPSKLPASASKACPSQGFRSWLLLFSRWVLIFPCNFLDPPTIPAFLTLSVLWEAVPVHPAFPSTASVCKRILEIEGRNVFWSQITWVQICHPLTLWLWASHLNFLGLLCKIWILVVRPKALWWVVNEVMLGWLLNGAGPFLIPDPWYGLSSLLSTSLSSKLPGLLPGGLPISLPPFCWARRWSFLDWCVLFCINSPMPQSPRIFVGLA